MRKLINFIIISTLIIFVLWNRIFREKIPLNLMSINQNYSLLIMASILIIINIIIFFNCIRLFIRTQNRITLISKILNLKFIRLALSIWHELLNSPKQVFNILAIKFSMLRNSLRLVTSYLAIYFNYPHLIVFSFLFIPRVIIATVFIIDIFYFKELYYFYTTLILAIIPLILKSYMYMVYFQSKHAQEFYAHHLMFKEVPDGLLIKIKSQPPIIEDALTLEEMQLKAKIIEGNWVICTRLLNYLFSIEVIEEQYKVYILLYTSALYIIGWSYILLFGLGISIF